MRSNTKWTCCSKKETKYERNIWETLNGGIRLVFQYEQITITIQFCYIDYMHSFAHPLIKPFWFQRRCVYRFNFCSCPANDLCDEFTLLIIYGCIISCCVSLYCVDLMINTGQEKRCFYFSVRPTESMLSKTSSLSTPYIFRMNTIF